MLINRLQQHYLWFFIFLSGLSGLALGNLAATVLGLLAVPAFDSVQLPAKLKLEETANLPLAHYNPILKRDIFNSAGNTQTFSQTEKIPQQSENTHKATTKWMLVGTISGGPMPLAILTGGAETASYRLNEELPDGSRLSAIERNWVELNDPNGQVLVLEINQDGSTAEIAVHSSRVRPANTNLQIEEIGDNQWQIPAEVAENARTNMGDLLRQAQAIPYLEDNQTTGFEIKMIQPGSLIAQLGLKKGDILREINGVALDSPEKALQVFGQVRQATQISIGLERRGKAMTFAYEIR